MKAKFTKAFSFAAAIGGAMIFAGCQSTPESRISSNPQAFSQVPPDQQPLVRAGQVSIGMTMEAVKLALGDPDTVTYRTDASGQAILWHYISYGYYDGVYLYGGPYWGPHGRHRHWGAWGMGWGGWDPYSTAVTVYERYRIEFLNGKVAAISQERPSP
jgi:hypothetical protein